MVTIGGVVWVTAERAPNGNSNEPKDDKKALGIMLALLGAAGQATGLVLAKAGMGESLAPLPATFIRMVAATAGIWLIGFIKRDNMETIRKIKDRRAMLLALGGSICGPFLGVWMSLVAVKNTEAGIAAAIMATVPILVIPLVIIFYREKVSLKAAVGAVIAVGGVALLFLS